MFLIELIEFEDFVLVVFDKDSLVLYGALVLIEFELELSLFPFE